MSRYHRLLELIDKHKPQSIVETGTWSGHNAIRMLTVAKKHHENPMYIGYDLFEDATDQTDQEEFNVKPHHTAAQVKALIEKECPFAEINLIRGNTRETLMPVEADFAFIDGGHSLETIRHDYSRLKNCKVIVFDDYYLKDEAHRIPDLNLVGCNKVIEGLNYTVIPSTDPVRDGGITALAVVVNG